MNKTIAVLVVIAIALASYIIFFNKTEAPIVDEACPTGTTRVGEGCMPLKDACELQGDQYYFDEATEECRTK